MEKNKMLIDATHPEETRVVAMRNGRVEEFDFESAARKLLRGNIYLAKVTRVEPSLQAAFIDYGGNRHGFLAFNEIHPDYYQIPVADREALKQEEAEAELRAEAEMEERARSRGPRRRRKGRNERSGPGGRAAPTGSGDDFAAGEASEVETFEDGYSTTTGYAPEGDDHPADDEPGRREPAAPLRHPADNESVRRSEPEADDPLPGHGLPAREAIEPVGQGEAAPTGLAPEVGYGLGDAPADDVGGAPRFEGHPADEAPAGWSAQERRPREPRHEDGHEDDADHGDDLAEANGNGLAEDDQVEQVSSDEDALEEVPERPRRRARQYKIQEVIKRRQIMLVQVVKEERGNKGAALTTYISLAGRYTVLMPNTARGGGISRKITQPQDRKRLKAIAEELDVPEGMGLIIRTAGAARTKQEIKRDYEYLLRLWESVRDLTLSSTAPAVVYEEGNIIKRAIRDLYSKEFDQIVVAGDAAHREAQDFMEMLMPGGGGDVASYRGAEPLFARYGIERQLNALFSPHVTLRSGGYLVINQTEALVAVDVNSGKATREFSIEETALNTNLEAAEEIARQLKLRDLAGLIVVDFIDMEEKRNNRAVERRLKDALRHDRARIQVGHISHFGLLEMSRQRLRAGVLEGSTSQCPHCQGTGIIRSIESVSLGVLRALEDHLIKQASSISVITTAEVALYILNHKRAFITEMERRYGVAVRVEASERMQGANFAIERISAPVVATKPAPRAAVSMEWGFDRDAEAEDETEDSLAPKAVEDDRDEDSRDEARRGREPGGEEGRGRKRRRRRGRRDQDRDGGAREPLPASAGDVRPLADDMARHLDDDAPPAREERVPALADEAHGMSGDDADDGLEPEAGGEPQTADGERPEHTDGEPGDQPRRGRRRGRRGGRSRRRETVEGQVPGVGGEPADDADRHEWGVAELAKPGAEQPSMFGRAEERTRPMGLVGSVEPADYVRRRERPARPAILETMSGGHDGPRRFDAAREAVRLAVRLASPVPVAVVARESTPEAPSPDLPPPATPAVASAPSVAEAPAAALIAPARPAPEITFREPAELAETEAKAPARPTRPETPLVEARNGGHPGLAEDTAAPEPAVAAAAETEDPVRPSRRGWWQRRFGSGSPQ